MRILGYSGGGGGGAGWPINNPTGPILLPRHPLTYINLHVCWNLTSLCHSNGHIETMPAREINPFTALTRIRSQFLMTQWSTSNHSEWTRLRLRPLSHRGWLYQSTYKIWKQSDKDFLSYRENDEVSADAAADAVAERRLNHSIPRTYFVQGYNYISWK